MGLLALAIAPGIVICLFIYLKDRYNKEPFGLLLMSFIFGMASIIPAYFIEIFFGTKLNELALGGALHVSVFAYAVVALTEELCKFLPLRAYSYTRKSFDEPFDGIVYAVMVGMGFATLENIGYVMQYGYANGVARLLLAVPAHGTFAILMGYYLALAKFKPEKKTWFTFLSILVPVLFHGTYDFFLFVGNTWLHLAGAIASLYIAIRLSFKAIRRKQAYSKLYLEQMAEIHKKGEEII